jgi:hypothetical protein
LKLSITIYDLHNLDAALEVLKEALADRGERKSGKLVAIEPHVDVLPHGGAEFDGETLNEYELGSWRITPGG